MTATPGSAWRQLLENRPSPRPLVVALANQKGGVGKTTVAVNLGAALAEKGLRTAIVDLDPQGNATTGVGIDRFSVEASVYDCLLGDSKMSDVVRETAVSGLECAPATVDLAGAEIELVNLPEREFRLRSALADFSGYDVTLIDCPPSLGLLTVNALTAAADLITPVQCEYYALEGLGQLLGTAERVRKGLNPGLRLSGVVLTMYDARTSQVSGEVRKHFGVAVYKAVVPRSVRLSEAPSFGEPILKLDPSARGSIAFRVLAAEFMHRYGLKPTEELSVRRGTPGPHGRGYGTVAPAPPDLESAWPPVEPWTDVANEGKTRTISLDTQEVVAND
jgi:chromosome partitioning protein